MEKNIDSPVKLAEESVRHFLDTGEILPCPTELSANLKQKAGAFVSIKKNKKLRGCIGSISPNKSQVAEEIIKNAVNAANKDPRFTPVTKMELPELTFSVDILNTPEKVFSLEELDCKRYGLIVKQKKLQGVLLPNLEGIDTVEKQVKTCKKKAGIKESEEVELFRFEARRYLI